MAIATSVGAAVARKTAGVALAEGTASTVAVAVGGTRIAVGTNVAVATSVRNVGAATAVGATVAGGGVGVAGMGAGCGLAKTIQLDTTSTRSTRIEAACHTRRLRSLRSLAIAGSPVAATIAALVAAAAAAVRVAEHTHHRARVDLRQVDLGDAGADRTCGHTQQLANALPCIYTAAAERTKHGPLVQKRATTA